jgi:hypothetical protein
VDVDLGGGTQLLDHQAGGRPVDPDHRADVDALTPQDLEDLLAERVAGHAAEPRHPAAEPRQADGGVRLGAADGLAQRADRLDAAGLGGGQGDQGLAEGQEVDGHRR